MKQRKRCQNLKCDMIVVKKLRKKCQKIENENYIVKKLKDYFISIVYESHILIDDEPLGTKERNDVILKNI